MINIIPLTSEIYPLYSDFISISSEANIYYTLDWKNFLEYVYGVKSNYLVAEEYGNIIGALPLALASRLYGKRRLISLPFSHSVPPIGDSQCKSMLVKAAIDLASEKFNCPLELRGFRENIEDLSSGSPYINTIINIPKQQNCLIDILRDNTRQQLKQALNNSSLVTELAGTKEDFVAMDTLMACNRRALGSATYPKDYFLYLSEYLGQHIRQELCYMNNIPIAMFVTSIFRSHAIYHYGASIPNPEIRKLRPNNLLFWNALSWANERGAEDFDCGTSLPHQKGLIRFKEGWGGISKPLPYTLFNEAGKLQEYSSPQDSVCAKFSGAALKILPLPLYKLFTPYILRNFG